MEDYKPGPNYRMSRQGKQMLSLIADPHERGEAKKLIIQSELTVQFAPKRNPLEKERSTKNVKNPKDESVEE
jgi:hypothetical protein